MQERLDIHPRKPIIDRLGLGNAMENLSLYIGDHWMFRARFPDPVVNTVDRTLVEFRAARVFERQEVLGFNHFVQLAAPGSKENVIAFLDREALKGRERSDLEAKIAAYSEGMREYLGSHAYAIGERLLRSASGIPVGEETPELRRMSEERLETALRAFEMAPEHRVLRDNLERVWRSMIQKEELKIAANLMQTACARLPEDEKFAYNWGLSYLLQEMYDEARVAFDRALDIRSDFFLARIHRGIALFCGGKRVQAREEIGGALEGAGDAGRAALSRSPLTRGLVDLILEGPESAAKDLEDFESRGPWAPLILRALQVASEGEEGVEPPR
jgi:tetratricopeptide (TPR) repeat protein